MLSEKNEEQIEIFATNGLSNIFGGDFILRMDKETNRLNHKQVIGLQLEDDLNNNVRVSSRSREDSRGVYAATIYLEGIRRKARNGRSSFFPKVWNREKVIDAVFEAYQNKILQSVSENQFVGQAADGMSISLWLDEAGKVIDAMPLIEGVSLRKPKSKGGRCCNQCGQQKHYVCLEHHPMKKKGLKKVYAKFRRNCRKVYFSIAVNLGIAEKREKRERPAMN